MSEQKYATWNPWHGCTIYSEGCRSCYVYRKDKTYGMMIISEQCRKTQDFDLPIKKNSDGTMKIESGSMVMTCFKSDFLPDDADQWRNECRKMIKRRNDFMFYFFTKRIRRFWECMPDDWGEGYDNVIVGCTCENQELADDRLPVLLLLPIKHKTIILVPMLGPVKLEKYLDDSICEVICSGESGINAHPLDYEWVPDVRRQCMNKGVPFQFHQTGDCFIKDGRKYRIPRSLQISQALKAGIDYKIADGFIPDFQS